MKNYKTYAKSAEIFKKDCGEYFALCDSENGDRLKKPYTVSGLCLHLNISRAELEKLAKKRTHSQMLRETLLKIESFIEEHALLGELSNTPALYSLKYNFGWTDKPSKSADEDSKNLKISLDGDCDKWAN